MGMIKKSKLSTKKGKCHGGYDRDGLNSIEQLSDD